MVSQETIKALEFDRVVSHVCEYCIAEDTKDVIRNTCFQCDISYIRRMHTLVQSICGGIRDKGIIPGVYVHSCTKLLNDLNGVLYTIEELGTLYALLCAMNVCARWYDDIMKSDENEDISLRTGFGVHMIPSQIHAILSRYFTEEGTLRLNSIAELKTIEREKANVRKARNIIAHDFLNAHSSWCASSTPAFRADRVVLVIDSTHKSKVPGIIHGTSSSDKSIYVEIPKLYDVNNKLALLCEQEHKVMYDLSVSLTKSVMASHEAIQTCYRAFLEFDELYARSCYAVETGGVFVSTLCDVHDDSAVCKDACITLIGAVHPLILNCKPIDIIFEAGIRQLIITGPNAGGKTVALKTLGLLVLMNQSGIPIPLCTDDVQTCVMPLFDCIEAVMGDRQNLDAGMSTFSGHMTSVSNAIQSTLRSNNALLLFDELCTDTDDREGGALACALLEYLSDIGTDKVCVTTHSAQVKQYAISSRYAQCPALRHEYDIRMNIHLYYIDYNKVGISEALKVAQNVGISDDILNLYKIYIEKCGKDYNDMLCALQDVYDQTNTIRKTLMRTQEEYENRMCIVQKLRKELANERLRYEKHTVKVGSELLVSMRQTMERLHEMYVLIHNQRDMPDKKNSNLQPDNSDSVDMEDRIKSERKAIRNFEKQVKKSVDTVCTYEHKINSQLSKADICEGDEVRIAFNGACGTVLSISSDKKHYRVQAGVVTLHLSADDCIPIKSQLIQSNRNAQSNEISAKALFVRSKSKNCTPPPSVLDVRGLFVHDSIARLQLHIDAMILYEMKTVSIIHGKGTGVLMREIHTFLATHPAVTRYRYADESDGGAGKTYAYLE